MKKLFICGGHVTPAIALIDTLTRGSTVEIVFIGRKFAIEGASHISPEYQLIREKGIRFLPIITGRFQRKFSAQTIPSFIKVPIGCVQAILFCLRERPDLVVSFGGYIALPVAIAAWILGIPIVTHEQTLSPGLTNRFIARIAKRIFVTFDETRKYFPKGKVVLTGLPMREDLFLPAKKLPYSIDEKHYPLIYITGGSLGAHSFNQRLFPAIAQLLGSYTIIHQTGSISLKEAREFRALQPKTVQDRYIIEPFISALHLSWIYSHSLLVIGRSGANTIMECATLGKVAILVPLPWSAGNEQLLHAKWLRDHGGALVIEQNFLTATILLTSIQKIRNTYDEYSQKAKELSRLVPREGSERLASEIYELLSSAS